MKAVLFVICVCAGTLGLTSAQCDYTEFTSCATAFSDGVMTATNSLTKICKLYNDFNACLNRISGCEDVKQQINSLTALYRDQLRVCDEGGQSSQCHDKLLQCVNATSSFQSFNTTTSQTCELLKRTRVCLMDSACENDPMVKAALQQVKSQIDGLKCDGSSPHCSDKIFQCSLFSIKPQTVQPTREELCEYTHKALNCLTDKKCENDPQVKTMLQNIRTQVVALKCEDKSPDCFDKLSKCSMAIKYNPGVQSDTPSKEEMCQQTKGFKDCLVKSGCHTNTMVKNALEKTKTEMDRHACVDGATLIDGNFLLCLLLAFTILVLKE